MAVQLYVVMSDNTLWDDLVCAKSSEAAVDYVIKNVQKKPSAKLATPMQAAMFKDNGHEVIGESDDLAEWQANEKLNEN